MAHGRSAARLSEAQALISSFRRRGQFWAMTLDLAKTLQAIMACEGEQARRALIVCPNTIKVGLVRRD